MQNPEMRKYIEGYVNDPSRTPEENRAAAENIQEHFKLKKAEAQQEQKPESALDFATRMKTDLQTQFFDHVENISDPSLTYAMLQQCVKFVGEKFWNQRRDIAQRVLSDLAHNKMVKPQSRLMAERVLAALEDQDRNRSMAA